MKEHNNRQIAKQHAEFITGKALRQFVAQKVKEYAGDNVSVFDGACGSGQLAQYINPSLLVGVDIQPQAVEVCRQNYPQSDVTCQSFFKYQSDTVCDVVVMNPPFSLKFKDLPAEEQTAIKAEFDWKKSGVVDDIFILKSLKHCKRFAFHIAFAGIGYRSTEQKLRELLGNQVAEIGNIYNAFDDTKIHVFFLVIDKQKTDGITKKYILDLKDGSKHEYSEDIANGWSVQAPKQEQEPIDIKALNKELGDVILSNGKNGILQDMFLIKSGFASIDDVTPNPFIFALVDELEEMADKHRLQECVADLDAVGNKVAFGECAIALALMAKQQGYSLADCTTRAYLSRNIDLGL